MAPVYIGRGDNSPEKGHMTHVSQDIVFWVLALASIGSALLVVQIRNLFQSALFLVLSFLSIAGLFVLLSAEFLAVVQILIYVGAISVLIIFAIMLSQDVHQGNRSTLVQPLAILVSVLTGALLIYGTLKAKWSLLPDNLPQEFQQVFTETPEHLATLLVRNYVLAFEIAGVLLLVAVISALAIVRNRP